MKIVFVFYSEEFQWIISSMSVKTVCKCFDQCLDSRKVISGINAFDPDEVVFLDNPVVSHDYANEIILDVIRNCKVKMICLYPLYLGSAEALSSESVKQNVPFQICKIIDLENKSYSNESLSLSVPVVYISGMTKFCEQIRTHSIISDLLSSKGIAHLNVTNSIYANILDYYNMNMLFDISDDRGQSYPKICSKVIETANAKMKEIVEKKNPELIIISDEHGISPFNNVMTNEYGLYNSILRYAIPYDYVIFCLFAQRYSQKSLGQIMRNVASQTLSSNVQLAMAHVFLDIMHEGLSETELSMRIAPSDYNHIIDENRGKSGALLLDSLSQKDLNDYLISLT